MSLMIPLLQAPTCEGCGGLCCRSFILPIDTPETREDFDILRWLVLHHIRHRVRELELDDVDSEMVNRFLASLPLEHRFAAIVDLVDEWGALGAEDALLAALTEVTGV